MSVRFEYVDQQDKDHVVTGPVLNPGDWWGQTYLISGVEWNVVVEADNEAAAIDILADSEAFGHLINISEEYLGEDADADRAGNDGHPVDLDDVQIRRVRDVMYKVSWPADMDVLSKKIAESLNPADR